MLFGCDSSIPRENDKKKSDENASLPFLSTQPSPSFPNGILAHPLGTFLVIEGIREEEGKVGVQTLAVDTINGRTLPNPINIWIDNVKNLPEGARCVLRGYESGKMIGLPREVAEKENLCMPQACWQFRHYFIVTSIVEPASLADETQLPCKRPMP